MQRYGGKQRSKEPLRTRKNKILDFEIDIQNYLAGNDSRGMRM